MKFGALLRQIRKEHGLTLRALAEHLGVTIGYVSDLERNNRRALRADQIVRLCKMIDTDPDGLLWASAQIRGIEITDDRKKLTAVAIELVKRADSLTDWELEQMVRAIKSCGKDYHRNFAHKLIDSHSDIVYR